MSATPAQIIPGELKRWRHQLVRQRRYFKSRGDSPEAVSLLDTTIERLDGVQKIIPLVSETESLVRG